MRQSIRLLTPLFALVALGAMSSPLGPPNIAVRAVTGTPPTPGAVLEVSIEHHHEKVAVSGRALTMRNGAEVERTITLTQAGSAERYGVAQQWERGTAWLLLFKVQQGDGGVHGTAEAMVRVNAEGRIGEITMAGRTNRTTDRFPRAFNASEIRAALEGLR